MKREANQNNRTVVRLKSADYSHAGSYFITICVKNQQCSLSRIENRNVTMTEIGQIAADYIRQIPAHFEHAVVDHFVVMPDHIHLILTLKHNAWTSHGMSLPGQMETNVGTCHGMSPSPMSPKHQNEFGKPIKGSVSVIINQFKSSVKRWCNKNNHTDFEWQSRFYEYIIRNDQEYFRIKDYIYSNPVKWKIDGPLYNGETPVK